MVKLTETQELAYKYMSDGKTSGYPTLSSIYWKYLLSEELIGEQNNNFTYQTMMAYVDGLGEYWVRLVEQMIPATTIWNTGVKYENSIFHRQKVAWRRQRGCQIVPIPCKPCSVTTNVFPVDCPVQEAVAPIYPWDKDPTVQSFSAILGRVITNYVDSLNKNINSCDLNSLNTEWFVDIRVNNSILVKKSFFNGVGFGVPNVSSPSNTQWYSSLISSLDDLENYGYTYYLTDSNEVVVYNSICSESSVNLTLTLNVGINFNICCN